MKKTHDPTNCRRLDPQTLKTLYYLITFLNQEKILAINKQAREMKSTKKQKKQNLLMVSLGSLYTIWIHYIPVKKSVILVKLQTSRETVLYSYNILFTDFSETCQNSYG